LFKSNQLSGLLNSVRNQSK